MSAVDLAAAVLPQEEIRVLSREPLAFRCHCSVERVEGGVSLLGPEELQEMIDGDEPARVRCDFCAEAYVIGIERLAVIARALRASR